MLLRSTKRCRTTNGTGLVSDATLAYLKGLDAGGWFSSDFQNERVPTLAEVLERYRGVGRFHIELKSGSSALPFLIRELLSQNGLLKPKPFYSPVMITSFDCDALIESHRVMPRIAHSWLVNTFDAKVISKAIECGLTGICPPADCASADIVELAQARGLHLRAWGVRSLAQLERVVKSGMTGATVDWPDKAKRHIASLLKNSAAARTLRKNP